MGKEIKVADILTPNQIVLNCGLEDGIKLGDEFIIYALGKVIIDPDSGDELEQLEIVRGEGKVINVQKKICTVQSTEFSRTPKTVRRGTTGGLLGSFATPTEETEIITQRLPFNQAQIGDSARKLN